MIDLFSLERVNKAPASFDAKKLFAFQERYMQALPVAEKVEQVLPFLVRAGLVTDADAARPFVTRVVEAAGPRMTVAGDILDYDYFFLPDDRLDFDPAAATKHLGAAYKGAASVPSLADVLTKLRAVVAGAEPFDARHAEGRDGGTGRRPRARSRGRSARCCGSPRPARRSGSAPTTRSPSSAATAASPASTGR